MICQAQNSEGGRPEEEYPPPSQGTVGPSFFPSFFHFLCSSFCLISCFFLLHTRTHKNRIDLTDKGGRRGRRGRRRNKIYRHDVSKYVMYARLYCPPPIHIPWPALFCFQVDMLLASAQYVVVQAGSLLWSPTRDSHVATACVDGHWALRSSRRFFEARSRQKK